MRFFFVFRRLFAFFGEKSTMRDIYIYATHSTFGWFTGAHIYTMHIYAIARFSEQARKNAFPRRKSRRWKAFDSKKQNPRRSVSRVLSCTVIYLPLPSPARSSDIHGVRRADNPMRRTPNLAASGVYMARRVTEASVSSYLAFPPLQKHVSAVYFCCTFLEVAFTWRYQAPCPMLLGLSSWRFRAPRPYNLLGFLYVLYHFFYRLSRFFTSFFKLFFYADYFALHNNYVRQSK